MLHKFLCLCVNIHVIQNKIVDLAKDVFVAYIGNTTEHMTSLMCNSLST